MDSSAEVWLFGLDDPLDQPFSGLLDEFELERARRFRSSVVKARYVSSHVQVRRVLSRYVQDAPGRLRFSRTCGRCGDGTHGKPHLLDYPAVHFNLSRSGGRGAMAVSAECDIGVDIELTTQDLDVEAVAGVACPPEGERLAGEVLRRWAIKEASAKAAGSGFATPFESIMIESLPSPRWSRVTLGEGDRSGEWADMSACVREVDGAIVAVASVALASPIRWLHECV